MELVIPSVGGMELGIPPFGRLMTFVVVDGVVVVVVVDDRVNSCCHDLLGGGQGWGSKTACKEKINFKKKQISNMVF